MVHAPLRISALHSITGYVLRIILKTCNPVKIEETYKSQFRLLRSL